MLSFSLQCLTWEEAVPFYYDCFPEIFGPQKREHFLLRGAYRIKLIGIQLSSIVQGLSKGVEYILIQAKQIDSNHYSNITDPCMAQHLCKIASGSFATVLCEAVPLTVKRLEARAQGALYQTELSVKKYAFPNTKQFGLTVPVC